MIRLDPWTTENCLDPMYLHLEEINRALCSSLPSRIANSKRHNARKEHQQCMSDNEAVAAAQVVKAATSRALLVLYLSLLPAKLCLVFLPFK